MKQTDINNIIKDIRAAEPEHIRFIAYCGTCRCSHVFGNEDDKPECYPYILAKYKERKQMSFKTLAMVILTPVVFTSWFIFWYWLFI